MLLIETPKSVRVVRQIQRGDRGCFFVALRRRRTDTRWSEPPMQARGPGFKRPCLRTQPPLIQV